MQISIVEKSSAGSTKLTILNAKLGQDVAKFTVNSGRTLMISVDDHVLGRLKAGKQDNYKLVKQGKDLVVVDVDSDQSVLLLQNFYDATDVTLSGGQWFYAADSQLHDVGDALAALAVSDAAALVASAALMAPVAAVTPLGALAAAGLGVTAAVAAAGRGTSANPVATSLKATLNKPQNSASSWC